MVRSVRGDKGTLRIVGSSTACFKDTRDTDLDNVRNRVVGILFGLVVTPFVFNYIWPEPVRIGKPDLDSEFSCRETSLSPSEHYA
jgi:hypothetical protein